MGKEIIDWTPRKKKYRAALDLETHLQVLRGEIDY
jgi:hypothetical protein